MKRILFLLFICLLPSFCVFGQTKAVSKIATKISTKATKKAAFEAAKRRTAKELLEEGIARTGRKYTGEALGQQITKRAIRENVLKRMEKEGIESFLMFGKNEALKDMQRLGISNVKQGILVREAATATRPSAYHAAIESYSKRNGSGYVSKVVFKNSFAKYAGKEGYKKFMKMSVQERMLEIKELTKHIYSLPKTEREKALEKLSPEMKEKVLATKRLMATRLPSSKKGYFRGEKGNSDFVLSDDYIWTDPKTREKMTVGELRKKYNIKESIVIPYHDGEPDFSKYAIGKVKVDYRDNIDYKDLKGLHDQATVKLGQQDWVRQNQRNDVINPTRDVIENMSSDGKYKRGCRNTYHETWDGTTILVVPDFINSACTHNGGRALAQIVQK